RRTRLRKFHVVGAREDKLDRTPDGFGGQSRRNNEIAVEPTAETATEIRRLDDDFRGINSERLSDQRKAGRWVWIAGMDMSYFSILPSQSVDGLQLHLDDRVRAVGGFKDIVSSLDSHIDVTALKEDRASVRIVDESRAFSEQMLLVDIDGGARLVGHIHEIG